MGLSDGKERTGCTESMALRIEGSGSFPFLLRAFKNIFGSIPGKRAHRAGLSDRRAHARTDASALVVSALYHAAAHDHQNIRCALHDRSPRRSIASGYSGAKPAHHIGAL